MAKAVWNGTTIAEGDDIVVVEGNSYFRPDDVRTDLFEDSDTHSHCPWKGEASYKTVVVEGRRNPDAAWYYPDPKAAAAEIKDRFAFWKGVTVS